jgi:hypothetical protein
MQADTSRERGRRLRTFAIALSVPCIFYGTLGVGSTLIVWMMIKFDPSRPDFYLNVLAAAGPSAFLLWLVSRRMRRSTIARAVACVLNVGCIALAAMVALTGPERLANPALAIILVLLVVGPALNLAVLCVGLPLAER